MKFWLFYFWILLRCEVWEDSNEDFFSRYNIVVTFLCVSHSYSKIVYISSSSSTWALPHTDITEKVRETCGASIDSLLRTLRSVSFTLANDARRFFFFQLRSLDTPSSNFVLRNRVDFWFLNNICRPFNIYRMSDIFFSFAGLVRLVISPRRFRELSKFVLVIEILLFEWKNFKLYSFLSIRFFKALVNYPWIMMYKIRKEFHQNSSLIFFLYLWNV